MVEVFKTGVCLQDDAVMLLNVIHTLFRDYKANFDLQDCDHILRVECRTTPIESPTLILLLQNFGFQAEALTENFVNQQPNNQASTHQMTILSGTLGGLPNG